MSQINSNFRNNDTIKVFTIIGLIALILLVRLAFLKHTHSEHTGEEHKSVTTKPIGETEAPVRTDYQSLPHPDMDQISNYLSHNLKYPDSARENDIEGRVVTRFRILPDGRIKDVSILKGIAGGCNQEAIRTLSNLPRIKLVGSGTIPDTGIFFVLPINFKLE